MHRLGEQMGSFLTNSTSKVYNFCNLITESSVFHRYSMQMLALLLFLFILHPGIDYRQLPADSPQPISSTIAPREDIYLQEEVEIIINSDLQTLKLFMSDDLVASYPVQTNILSSLQWTIHRVSNDYRQGKTLAILTSPTSSSPTVLCGRSISKQFRQQIRLDDDFLEILYPYLRPGTKVRFRKGNEQAHR